MLRCRMGRLRYLQGSTEGSSVPIIFLTASDVEVRNIKGHGILCKLAVIKSGVSSVFMHQLFMVSNFFDISVLHI